MPCFEQFTVASDAHVQVIAPVPHGQIEVGCGSSEDDIGWPIAADCGDAVGCQSEVPPFVGVGGVDDHRLGTRHREVAFRGAKPASISSIPSEANTGSNPDAVPTAFSASNRCTAVSCAWRLAHIASGDGAGRNVGQSRSGGADSRTSNQVGVRFQVPVDQLVVVRPEDSQVWPEVDVFGDVIGPELRGPFGNTGGGPEVDFAQVAHQIAHGPIRACWYSYLESALFRRHCKALGFLRNSRAVLSNLHGPPQSMCCRTDCKRLLQLAVCRARAEVPYWAAR